MNLLEIAKRAMTGPKVGDMDWYMSLYRKMQEVQTRYKLTYPTTGDEPVLFDEAQRSDYFQAALDFLAENGVYCAETHRVIKLSGEEIRDAVREAPGSSIIGEGADRRVVARRRFDGDASPPIVGGGLHLPIRQDLTNYVPQAFASIPRIDYLEGFTFAEVDGYEIYGAAIEGYASRRELAWMREGVRKAGRPGLSITYYPISTKASTLIAPMDPDHGLRRSDGLLLTIVPGAMINYDYITASIVYEQYGISHRRNLGGGGGAFAAGPIGDTVGYLATAIAAWIVYHDNHQMATPLPVAQILDDKTRMVRFGFYASSAGCLGLKGMLRMASEAMTQVAAGNHIVSGGTGRVESLTPTEVELVAEVADAVVKSGLHVKGVYETVAHMEEEQGVKEFFKRFQTHATKTQIITGCDGQDYGYSSLRTNYDFVRMRPTKQHYEDYLMARRVLMDHGLPMD